MRERITRSICCAALLGLAGCMPATVAGQAAESTPFDEFLDAPTTREAEDALRRAVDASEGPTPEIARAAFAWRVVPLPDVHRPRADPPRASSTPAVLLALRFWDDHSPSQRQAITEALFLDRVETEQSMSSRRVGRRRILGLTGVAHALHHEPALQDLGLRMAEEVAKFVEWDTSLPRMQFASKDLDNRAGYALPAEPRPDRIGLRPQQRGALHTCLVVIDRSLDGREREETLQHEVFHCLQFASADVAHDLRVPGWVAEGQASWVAQESSGGTPWSEDWWRLYLETSVRLYAREYDAIGFWTQVDRDSAFNLRAHIFDLYRAAVDDDTAFAAVLSRVSDGFLDRWPAQVVRNGALGPAWWFTGPGLPEAVHRTPMKLPVGPNEPVENALVARRARDVQVLLQPQAGRVKFAVLELRPRGVRGSYVWQLPDGRGAKGGSFSDGRELLFCLTDECGCVSAANRRAENIPSAPSGELHVAITGIADRPSVLDVFVHEGHPSGSVLDAICRELHEDAVFVGICEQADAALVADNAWCVREKDVVPEREGEVYLLPFNIPFGDNFYGDVCVIMSFHRASRLDGAGTWKLAGTEDCYGNAERDEEARVYTTGVPPVEAGLSGGRLRGTADAGRLKIEGSQDCQMPSCIRIQGHLTKHGVIELVGGPTQWDGKIPDNLLPSQDSHPELARDGCAYQADRGLLSVTVTSWTVVESFEAGVAVRRPWAWPREALVTEVIEWRLREDPRRRRACPGAHETERRWAFHADVP